MDPPRCINTVFRWREAVDAFVFVGEGGHVFVSTWAVGSLLAVLRVRPRTWHVHIFHIRVELCIRRYPAPLHVLSHSVDTTPPVVLSPPIPPMSSIPLEITVPFRRDTINLPSRHAVDKLHRDNIQSPSDTRCHVPSKIQSYTGACCMFLSN